MAATKGPWRVFHEGKVVAVMEEKSNREVVHWMGFDSSDFPRARLANAHLIAVSPDLLAALKLILPLAKGYAPKGQSKEARQTCNEWIAAAIAAIERAEPAP